MHHFRYISDTFTISPKDTSCGPKKPGIQQPAFQLVDRRNLSRLLKYANHSITESNQMTWFIWSKSQIKFNKFLWDYA